MRLFHSEFFQSLQYRVFSKVVLIMLLLVLVFGGHNFWQLRQEAEQDFKQQQRLVVNMLSVALVEPLWQFNLSQVERILLAYQEVESLYAIDLKVRSDPLSPRFFGRNEQNLLVSLKAIRPIEGQIKVPLNIIYEQEQLAQLELYFSAEPIVARTHQQVATLVAKLLLLAFALVIFSYMLIELYVGRPIQSLRNIFARLASNAKFEPASSWTSSLPESELRLLAESYAEVYTQLNQYRELLELRVGERTQELSASNKSLRAEIEQRAKTESLLTLATAQAERANQEKTRFLARITHELRTPVNGIIGYGQLLQDQLQGRELEYVQNLQRCGHHLATLINNILDLNRIESGVMEERLQVFDLRSLVDDVRVIVLPKALAKSLHFKLELDVERFHVRADLEKLRQVLINLLSNAIKYTEVGSVSLIVLQRAAHFLFKVQDTGLGIHPDDRQRIFEPFRQATYQPEGESTGLGLAISRALIRHMGGELLLESQLGQGACFYFNLKLAIEESIHTSTAAAPKALILAQEYRVLVVDDNTDNRQVLAGQLQRLGFKVQLAVDAESGLHYLQQSPPPHLVLMDLQLPGMSGVEATHIINKTYPGLPVVAFTASVFMGDNSWEALFAAVLYKPVEQSSLLHLLHKLLDLPFAIHQLDLEPEPQAIAELAITWFALLEPLEQHQLAQWLRSGQIRQVREFAAQLELRPNELGRLGAFIHKASRQYQLNLLEPLLASIEHSNTTALSGTTSH